MECGKLVANIWSNLQPDDFYPGDEGCRFLQNISIYLPIYMASNSMRSSFLFLFPFFGDDTVLWWLVCQPWGNVLSHLPAEMTKQWYGRNNYNSTPWGSGEICTLTGIFVAHMEAQQNFLFLCRVNFLKFLMKLGCETVGWNIKKQKYNILHTRQTSSNQTVSGSSSVISSWRRTAPGSWNNWSSQHNITTQDCLYDALCILFC